MKSNKKNKLTPKTGDALLLQEALSRFVDETYSLEDMAMIINSLRNNENFYEFHELWDKLLADNINQAMSESDEQKEVYRQEAVKLRAKYEQLQHINSQNTSIPNTRHFRKRKIWFTVAASLLIGLMIPAAYYFTKTKYKPMQNVQYIEITTQRGEKKTIILPDQTKVTLNAKSRFAYPKKFNERERSVDLQGEALFEVFPDSKRPFKVNTENMKISVLGTVFDVKAYSEDELQLVSVASGRVEVCLLDGNVLLEENHQLKMNKATGNFEKLSINASLYLSWTDGTLYFHRTPIHEVVNMINRYYPQIDIELTKDNYSILLSGKHDNKSLEAVLTAIIYSTDLKYKRNGKKIILYQ